MRIRLAVRRFLISSFPQEAKFQINNSSQEISIVIVATAKDFDVLPITIKYAIRAISEMTLLGVTVIVPGDSVEDCKHSLSTLGPMVAVLDENEFLAESLRSQLKSRFDSRYGWVLQQILKTDFVSRQKRGVVLVLDADTVLIQSRHWMDDSNHQILMPTHEFHSEYYYFLIKLGIIQDLPDFSMVPHQMIMQPEIVREIYTMLGWNDKQKMIDDLINLSNVNSSSPFCIDYELYAQYLRVHRPEIVNLIKWSNISMPRPSDMNFLLEEVTKGRISNHASVSFHSYL